MISQLADDSHRVRVHFTCVGVGKGRVPELNLVFLRTGGEKN